MFIRKSLIFIGRNCSLVTILSGDTTVEFFRPTLVFGINFFFNTSVQNYIQCTAVHNESASALTN